MKLTNIIESGIEKLLETTTKLVASIETIPREEKHKQTTKHLVTTINYKLTSLYVQAGNIASKQKYEENMTIKKYEESLEQYCQMMEEISEITMYQVINELYEPIENYKNKIHVSKSKELLAKLYTDNYQLYKYVKHIENKSKFKNELNRVWDPIFNDLSQRKLYYTDTKDTTETHHARNLILDKHNKEKYEETIGNAINNHLDKISRCYIELEKINLNKIQNKKTN